MQSRFIIGKFPTFGPVTARLVEYGFALLHNDHKGHIAEPLAFLSIMKWFETQGLLKPGSNLQLRLGREIRGCLYLLRQLRYPVPFTTIFDFHDRCTPSWANEQARIVPRLDNVDVALDLPGGALLNLVHHASCIEEVIDWIDNPDTASVLFVTNNLFGPNVLARCHSSSLTNTTVPPRTVLLMGQLESHTVVDALTSLNRDQWFKRKVCYFNSLLS